MKPIHLPFIFLVVPMLLIFVISCGDDSPKDAAKQNEQQIDLESSAIAVYLPASFEMGGLRVSNISRYTGQKLAGLIKDAENILMRYDCQEAVTAIYKSEVTEIEAEIFSFPDEAAAFGLYSVIRPPEAEPLDFNVEGYTTEKSVVFVKGELVVRLVPVDPEKTAPVFTYKLARALDEILPGTSGMPEQFDQFPTTNRVPHSERIYADAFLGHAGISKMHTITYALDADTVTLFWADDSSGGKYYSWYTVVEELHGAPTATNFPFDHGYSFKSSDGLYGNIIVGLKSGKLCGMLGYSDKHKGLLTDWLNTLTSADDQ